MKTKHLNILFFIFINFFCYTFDSFALGKLDSISIVGETNQHAFISIKYQGYINIKKKCSGRKLILLLSGCSLNDENSKIQGERKTINLVTWSYSEKDKSVWITIEFNKYQHYKISNLKNEILILAYVTPLYGGAEKHIFRKYFPMPEHIKSRVQNSWNPNCPISLNELSYLMVSHWGFDQKVLMGELVVHSYIASEVLEIFKDLFKNKFQIEKICLIDEYDNNDNESMKDNNTSAFNCRLSTGSKNIYSKHSYGLAVDINPVLNPYLKHGVVLPPEGKKYLNREEPFNGMIIKNKICYNAFIKRGWKWGGEWKTLKDYQHFEKPMHLQ